MNDWKAVTDAEPWKVADAEAATVSTQRQQFRPTTTFLAAFPQLSALLCCARRSEVRLPSGRHILFAWGDANAGIRAWLCPIPPEVIPSDAAPDHRLLLSCFGGIVERFNEPSDNLLLNHNQAMTAVEVGRDATFLAAYAWAFEECGGIPIVTTEWYPVAWEANGNCVLCSRKTGELLFFAHDHANGQLVPYNQCPMYTLHKHRLADSFREWVEDIAEQWAATA